MRFRTTILQAGKTATGIEVPAELVESLRAGKRAKIRVTINGYTYRSSVAPLGGVFMVGVSAEVREAAHVGGGDDVDVEIELDTEPRVLSLPADFEAALDAEPGARQRFDALSFSNQQRLVLPIEDAKTPETRQRRIDKAIGSVRGR
ncbi:MAG TPA: YdeI/OmpD-associated family protein [Candidatus Limnocylindrales bacterium]|jgi:predicted thioesterase